MNRLLITCLLVLALLPATAAAAAPPSCPDDENDPLGGSGEVFGIGPDHVVTGDPERSSGAGAILVRDGGHKPRTVTLALVPGGGAPAAGDRFGAAVATGMLQQFSPCTETVVGAPGRGGAGEAYLLRGSTSARPRAAVVLRAPDAAPGDEFGASVALSVRDETAIHDLWIGAPGRDVAGQADAGAIYHWVIDADANIAYAGAVTQGSALAPDAPEAGDRFGELLAPTFNGLLVGVPREDVGNVRDAGAVVRLRVSGAGVALPGRFADQSGTETPEANDRFGAAVISDSNRVFAGVPGEDVRGRRDAGVVAELTSGLKPRRTLRQGSPGVPGRAEAGDRFGSALATGAALYAQEDSAIAIGVPGEDARGVRDAGAVTIFQRDRSLSYKPRELFQGRGLPGRPHSRERTGATLGVAHDRPGLDEDTADTLLVGVAGGGFLTTNSGVRRKSRSLTAPAGRVFALPASRW